MTSEIEYKCNNCGHEGLNTRAVPDVPELGRYDPNNKTYPYFEMEESELGDYIRYDQAAEMLAAERGRADDFKMLYQSASRGNEKLREKLKATEAELTKIKTQEPVDQTAEIERLRKALCEVHATIEHDRTGKFKSAQNVINAALSEKGPS